MKKTGRTKSGSQEAKKQLMVPSLATVLRAELHAFVISAGMRVVDELLEEDRTSICGPRYEHPLTRKASRAGHAPGELVLGDFDVQRVRSPAMPRDCSTALLPPPYGWCWSSRAPRRRR